MTTSLWIVALGIVGLFAVLYHLRTLGRVADDSYCRGYDAGVVYGLRMAQARRERESIECS